MKTKDESTYIGWMLFNTGIPVYPTLFTTRRECKNRILKPHGYTQGQWAQFVKDCGNSMEIRKVEIRESK